jgi:hypothetical protein
MSCGSFADCSLSFIRSNIAKYPERDIATETVVVPILNSHSSDDEILGLTTHLPRKSGRAGLTRDTPDSGMDEQLDLDFGGSDSETGKRAVRGHDAPEPDDLTADVNDTSDTLTSSNHGAALCRS